MTDYTRDRADNPTPAREAAFASKAVEIVGGFVLIMYPDGFGFAATVHPAAERHPFPARIVERWRTRSADGEWIRFNCPGDLETIGVQQN